MRIIFIKSCILLFVACLFGSCKRKDVEPTSTSNPILISPVNNSKMHIDSLHFSWNGVAGNSYLIEISSDNAFSNIIDSATVDSPKYFSALQYSSPIFGYPSITPTTTNYVMGEICYWRVYRQSKPISYSAVQSFIIIDTRDSIVGTWFGNFNVNTWVGGNTTDTSYQGTLTISKNTDGSISASVLGYILYPSTSNDYDFLNGCVSCTGSHSGVDCNYTSTTKTLRYSTSSGGEGSLYTTTFTATR